MRAIIHGLRYDTDKAVLVGENDNIGSGASSRTDFGYWSAGLYKTPRSGRYFLAGEGGPMSRFSRRVDNSASTWGSGIIPLTAEEAYTWAEKNLPTETVEEEFGDQIEDA